MIDLADFYAQLGAPRSLGEDEQLLLPGEVRVQVTPTGWTALFEGLPADGNALLGALAITPPHGLGVMFLSRSGHLGMRWQSPGGASDTFDALRALQALIRQLQPS